MTAVQAGTDLTFPLAGLLAEPAGARRDFAIERAAVDVGPDLLLAQPVSGRVRFSRTNRGILVSGVAETALDLACVRCLRPIELPLVVAIDEEALPSVDLASGRALDTSVEPELARLTDHHEIELEPILREAILLAEPIAPVCRPDCPGLCFVCGERLDDGPHDHDEPPLDPRLEALRAFRVDADAETG